MEATPESGDVGEETFVFATGYSPSWFLVVLHRPQRLPGSSSTNTTHAVAERPGNVKQAPPFHLEYVPLGRLRHEVRQADLFGEPAIASRYHAPRLMAETNVVGKAVLPGTQKSAYIPQFVEVLVVGEVAAEAGAASICTGEYIIPPWLLLIILPERRTAHILWAGRHPPFPLCNPRVAGRAARSAAGVAAAAGAAAVVGVLRQR
jgi:hypothetical protein